MLRCRFSCLFRTYRLHNPVPAVHENNLRVVLRRPTFFHPLKTRDDHPVADYRQPRRRSVQANLSRAALRRYRVPCYIVDIPHMHRFIRPDIHRFELTFVPRDTAPVVEIRMRDGSAVQLGFKQFPKHRVRQIREELILTLIDLLTALTGAFA
jgi:hypothetical protein